jgi:hypothetical protein
MAEPASAGQPADDIMRVTVPLRFRIGDDTPMPMRSVNSRRWESSSGPPGPYRGLTPSRALNPGGGAERCRERRTAPSTSRRVSVATCPKVIAEICGMTSSAAGLCFRVNPSVRLGSRRPLFASGSSPTRVWSPRSRTRCPPGRSGSRTAGVTRLDAAARLKRELSRGLVKRSARPADRTTSTRCPG